MTIDGDIIVLKDQERSKWNSELIQTAQIYLQNSSKGEAITRYHLEVIISAEHCIAKSYIETNWVRILTYYDNMITHADDPVIRLNRCMIVMECQGAKVALEAMKDLQGDKLMTKYY